MHRFYYNSLEKDQKILDIDGEIFFQIVNVLRLKIDEKFVLFNGQGYEAVYTLIKKTKTIKCELHSIITPIDEPSVKVKILLGLCKPERFELVLQKCTELGAFDFTPLITERVQGGKNAYPSENRLKRWNKILKESAEQSGRTFIPTLNNPRNILDVFDEKIRFDNVICLWEEFQGFNINQALNKLSDIKSLYVIIGPPGGFSKEEAYKLKKLGVMLVSLGKRILRSETAAIAVMSSVIYHYGDFKD
ncbi:MAG: RsmE family RNA methyltransferase [Dehalococcoidia bacterium]